MAFICNIWYKTRTMEMKEVNGSVKSEDLDEIKTEMKNDSKKTKGRES